MTEIFNLPKELQHYIMGYVGYPVPPHSLAIKQELNIYHRDHNWHFTRMTKIYFIDNIMSFSEYYLDKILNPHGYLSYDEDL